MSNTSFLHWSCHYCTKVLLTCMRNISQHPVLLRKTEHLLVLVIKLLLPYLSKSNQILFILSQFTANVMTLKIE